MHSGYKIIEHPSDLGIEAYGTSLAEAFQNAAVGLMSVILDVSLVESQESRIIELEANDVEQLLVRWLSEILYFYDGKHFVPSEFSVSTLTPKTLTALVRGEPFSATMHRTKLDVKAVTYHQLVVRKEQDGAYVRVFLDI